MKEIDTSIDGFKAVGININQKQLEELSMINIGIVSGLYNNTPIFPIMLTLKAVDALPPHLVDNVCGDKGGNDSSNETYDFVESVLGKTKE